MTLISDIDADIKAENKLEKAAKKNEGVTLTADEVQRIWKHIEWLGEERESLLSSGAFDDD